MWHDSILGGRADKKKPADFSSEQLHSGMGIEREHSSNPLTQKEISMDHLSEDPDYYKNQASYNEHTISCKKAKNKNYHPQVFTDNRGHTYFRTRGTYVDTA